ncbi:unnamed protein product [Albugo candida]|uniref:Uncharacterized protein n=3 Tax=Albugo candida TaxID=65357 RepID=A0A024GRR5_9STRA|nr:unnamed protein product [Albugo candida]|eukprot:CCI49610.1 unnamed protein product [Albugo candida]
MRDAHEMWMMLLITVVTNITMFPAVWCLHKSGRVFDTCFGLLTAITSCLYHICDSIDSPLWLDEGQWHRLDNIATITSIVCWIVYLMDIQQRVVEEYTQYVLFIFVLIFQQKNPWDPANSFAPILGSLLILMFRYMLFHPIPSYHKRELGMGFLFLFCGVCFYIRGLDDENDPYRFFHGCWHGLSGIAAYYNVRILANRQSVLPLKQK